MSDTGWNLADLWEAMAAQIPDELAASTVRTEATEALQIIRQRILTRAGLLELANEFEIYGPPNGPERRSMTPDDVVEDLRRRINIETTGGSRRGAAEEIPRQNDRHLARLWRRDRLLAC